MAKYLDQSGLSYFYQKLKAEFNANFASVSSSISNGTISSGATKKLIGDEYKTEVTPAEGYYISAITVTMDGIDITDQVFEGVDIDDATYQTIYNGSGTITEDSGGNYLWISELGSVPITQGSVWKITWNGTERTHTAVYKTVSGTNQYVIDGQNDGTNAPYMIFVNYGAWIVGVGSLTGAVTMKIEQQISS